MSDFFQVPCVQETGQEVRTEQQQQQKHEFRLIGRARTVPGHRMFSFNLKTGEIKLAPMKYEVSLDARTRKPVRSKKICIEKDCVYRQALNKKNFIKRLVREKFLAKVPAPNK